MKFYEIKNWQQRPQCILTCHLRFPSTVLARMLVSVKDTRWRGQGRSDEAEPPSCHAWCPLLMLLNEETQLCNTITGMLSTKKNRCFICSAQNTNGNVCLSAAVLPWQIWNYAVTNTKWLLSTNPCKQIGRNPMDKLGGARVDKLGAQLDML